VNKDVVLAGLDELFSLVAISDVNALQCFKLMRPNLLNYFDEEKVINRLNEAINRFDFTEASKLIKQIQNTIHI